MHLFGAFKSRLTGDIDMISAYKDHISPCNDCRYCWKNERCKISDNMQKVYSDINDYDNIVIVSPLYFSELSGALLSMCSRLQFFWTARNFRNTELITRKKNGILILAGAGDGDTLSAERSANIIFHHLKAQNAGSVFSLRTAELPAKDDQQALLKAAELAEFLNSEFLKNKTAT